MMLTVAQMAPCPRTEQYGCFSREAHADLKLEEERAGGQIGVVVLGEAEGIE